MIKTTQNNSLFCLALFMAQVMVGINIVGAKFLVGQLSIIFIITVRFVIAIIFLLILHGLSNLGKKPSQGPKIKDLTKRDWVFIVAQGLCAGVFFNLLMLFGLHFTNANAAGIVSSALPALIVVLSILFLGERLTLLNTLCVGFAVAGLLIINAHNFHNANSHNLFGDFIILLSLLPEAAYYILVKMHVTRLPVFLLSALLHVVNLPILFLIALGTTHFFPTQLPLKSIAVLMSIGTASALFYVFWSTGCKRISGTTAGLFTAGMPIATLVIAWLFLHEAISGLQLFGMLFVIASIAFNALSKGKKAKLKVDEMQPL